MAWYADLGANVTATLCTAMLVIACTGCASAGKGETSRMTAGDILETGDQIRESLGESAWLAGRDASSPPIRLGVSQAVNKSQDRLAASDCWAFTANVVYDDSVQQLFTQKNIRLYLPDDTEKTLTAMGLGPDGRLAPGLGVDRSAPTHVLRAEIRSLARQGAAERDISDERLDVNLIDYRITEFDSSTVVWAKTVRVSREARGTVAD